MKTDTSGQVLAFFSQPSTTYYCGVCNRDMALRYRLDHPSTKSHLSAAAGARPKRVNYMRRLRQERPRLSIYAFGQSDDANDAAQEEYYRQCAIEDGTTEAIEKEYGNA